ncbi:hypothetical protein A0H81_10270 [Grifola frondosa]|uniref:Uncharacterized protein n=1 Tax=Grifola frondosa TaxID=5627 RepID=A0A1C7LYT6_GRIFR|nr:hypothetical protein A0H81_10270 [Grifola frondosa]
MSLDVFSWFAGSGDNFEISKLEGHLVVSVDSVDCREDLVEIGISTTEDVIPDGVGDLWTVGLAEEFLLCESEISGVVLFESERALEFRREFELNSRGEGEQGFVDRFFAFRFGFIITLATIPSVLG